MQCHQNLLLLQLPQLTLLFKVACLMKVSASTVANMCITYNTCAYVQLCIMYFSIAPPITTAATATLNAQSDIANASMCS